MIELIAVKVGAKLSLIGDITAEVIEKIDLSRDSWLGQRNDHTLSVQVSDCPVNGRIEFGDASECLVSQVVRLQIVPDDLDVVQFGGIFRQPFDREPVRASGKGRL